MSQVALINISDKIYVGNAPFQFAFFNRGVVNDSGTLADPDHTEEVIEDLFTLNLLQSASLVCTCDSGKVDKLYYISP